jgi:hypothetical protein
MDKNLICGTAITGVVAGLSYFMAQYVADDPTQTVIVGAIIVSLITFLSQWKTPPKPAQELCSDKKAVSVLCPHIGIKWK